MSAATKNIAKSAAATEEAVTPYYSVDALVTDYQKADVAGVEAQSVFDQAQATLRNVAYLKARTVYLIATHEEVLTVRTKKSGSNLSGAAERLGANRTTLIPYFVAGEALVKKGLIHDGVGSAEGLDVVSASLDATTRQASKDARAKAKAKAEAGKVALELQGKTASGEDVPAPAPAAEVPTPGAAAVKAAVESEGTLSVTEEPKRQAPDTTPDTRPNAEPVEVSLTTPEGDAGMVVDYITRAVELADGAKFTTAQKEAIAEMLAELAAHTA